MLHVFSKLGISLLINIIPDPSWHVIGIIICQSIFRGELISVNGSQFNVEPNKAALHHLSRQYLGGILTLSLRRHLNNAPSCYTEHYKI